MQKKIIFFIFGFLPLLLLAQKKSAKKGNANAVAAIPSIQAPLKLWYDNPAKYFEEASSINFKRSSIYGIGVIWYSIRYRLAKWGWKWDLMN